MSNSAMRLACWPRGSECVADIVASVAPEHDRALKHKGEPLRRRGFAPAPSDAPARNGDKSHGRAQERRLAGAVRADQNSGSRTAQKNKRDAVEDRHVCRDDRDFCEHNGQF
jgi:hypothetical protein